MLQAITMQDFQVIASAALLAEHSMVRTVACQGGNPGKAFIREGSAPAKGAVSITALEEQIVAPSALVFFPG